MSIRRNMVKTTKTITLSLPPETAEKIEEIAKEEGRTRSELLREALTRYVEEKEWREILRYGEMKAKEAGIKRKDIEKIIDECRT
jgi:CopG family transcriptional regulator/antitoxin EndoAI